MKHNFTLIALMALILLVMAPVQAQTITMSNPDSTGQRDLLVYYPNSTLVGLYNTTSIITLDANYSYVFVLKPQGNSAIDDPADWLTNTVFPWVRTNAAALIVLGFLAGLVVFGGRR